MTRTNESPERPSSSAGDPPADTIEPNDNEQVRHHPLATEHESLNTPSEYFQETPGCLYASVCVYVDLEQGYRRIHRHSDNMPHVRL